MRRAPDDSDPCCAPAEPDLRPIEGPEADEELAALAKAIANPARVLIMRLLARRSACICGEIVSELPLAQSTVSQHLKVLKEVGLVFDRPSGTRRVYQVDPAAVAALREYFDAFWSNALASFRSAAEQPEQPTEPRSER